MKKWFMTFLVIVSFASQAQTDIVALLNFPVGGTWVSDNEKNDQKPNSFNMFYMEFKTWSSRASILGNIYGIRNNGDTIQLMEVWNFINTDNESAFLVQRTSWGDIGIGSVTPFEGEHLDIAFKTTTSSGSVYYTRDIHYIVSEDEMKAKTYHRETEAKEWKLAGESTWKRKKS